MDREFVAAGSDLVVVLGGDGTLLGVVREAAAARVESDAGRKPEAQVQRAFDLSFGREPSEEESREAVALVKDAGLRALFRAIFNANEFVYLD